MKTSITLLLAFYCIAASAQISETAATVPTVKWQPVKVGPNWVSKGLGSGFAFGLRSFDSTIFVQLLVFPAFNGVMDTEDPLVFKLDNDSTVVANSVGMQLRSTNYKVPYEYRITLEDVRKLQQTPAVSLRIYSAGSYKDNAIAKTSRQDIQQVCTAFLQAYERQRLSTN